MKKILFFLVVLPAFAIAQGGMQFEHGLSWKDIQAKAKAEKKYIFMDAFTTWCGPCRYMSANIFPKEEVGQFFNPRFLNVKMQLDTSKNDNDEVKKLYNDAHEIMTKYKVNVFPTYLFFDPNGKLVHRAVGSSEAEKFIAKGMDAIDPEKQYYVLLEKYKAGKKDPEFLRNLAYVCRDAYDREYTDIVSKEYLKTQHDLWTEENVKFIDNFTRSSKDAGFALIHQNPAKFDEARGAGAANKKIVDIVMAEEVFSKIFRKDVVAPDWNGLTKSLNDKYPLYAKEILATARVNYYQRKQDWNNFEVAVIDFMKDYGKNVNPDELNSFAWTIFENCKDMTCVKEALSWSKRSFEGNNKPMFIDTYANILYKLGRKDEAIDWQTKAVALVGEEEKKHYSETLDKMKKGEKTWKE